MSIKVMTQVWDKSAARGRSLIVLLAIADNSNDEGISWPGTKTLLRKCRIGSLSTLYKCLDELKAIGELDWITGNAKGKSNRYKILVNNLGLQTGVKPGLQTGVKPGLQTGVKEPSFEPSFEPLGAKRARPNERSILEAFCEESGIPEPKPATPKENKSAAALWWQPVRRMCQLANGRGPEIARAAVRKLRKDKMTVSTPASIEKTFTALFSETKDKPSVKVITAADVPPMDVSPDERARALALLNKRLGKTQ